MEYQILERANPYDLASLVNAAIGEGWTPTGGVSHTFLYNPTSYRMEHSYTQAMTRFKPNADYFGDYRTGQSDTAVVTLTEINQRMLAR